MYPKILQVEASRNTGGNPGDAAEFAVSIHVIAEVSNAARNTLEKSYKVSGNRLLVLINQKSDPPPPNTIATQHAGKKQLEFKVSAHEVNIASLRYIDVYGGEYDANNSKRVVLQ